MAYEFITDPGHGWLKVPLNELKESGYQPSEFSYFNDTHAYLEEDCDASLFLHKIGVRKPNLTYRETIRFNTVALRSFPSKPHEVTMSEMESMYADREGEILMNEKAQNRIKNATLAFLILTPLSMATITATRHEWVAVACGIALFIATLQIMVAERRAARNARV